MRFTIRRLMLAIAITAIVLWGGSTALENRASLVESRWAGAGPFWATVVLSTASATAWVVASRRKKPGGL